MGEGSYHMPQKMPPPHYGGGKLPATDPAKLQVNWTVYSIVFLTVSGENIVVFTSAYLDQIALVRC